MDTALYDIKNVYSVFMEYLQCIVLNIQYDVINASILHLIYWIHRQFMLEGRFIMQHVLSKAP